MAPSYGESPEIVSADVIRTGCLIYLYRQDYPLPDDPSGYNVIPTWKCRNDEKLSFDKYEIEGANPEVVAVLYWKRNNIVILVKWSVNSRAADYSGDYYKVFIYKYSQEHGKQKIVRNSMAMKKFPEGMDGQSDSGKVIKYPFKDAAAIRKRLRTISFE
jgi:hypothetical protein